MHDTFVESGLVYDRCLEIKTDKGAFTPAQVDALNNAIDHRHEIFHVVCEHTRRYGITYVVSTQSGGIPCDPERRLPRIDAARSRS